MKEERDYIRDITEIRSMMERSSKFLSLSGWAGVMAGLYALSGAYVAYKVFQFDPDGVQYDNLAPGSSAGNLMNVSLLALVILILSIGTAILLSYRKAGKKGERLWNASARQLVISMAVPLVAGGLLILILIAHGLVGLAAPSSLLFYGLALFNAGKFTYGEVRFLGLIQIVLGLISACFVEHGLLLWSVGFGIFHIIYGIYIHYKYER
jgi:hypothetical protein